MRSLCHVEVWDGVLDEDPIKDPRVLQLDWSQWVLSNLSPVPAIPVLTIATFQQRSLCRVEVWNEVLDEDPIKDPQLRSSLSNLSPMPAISVLTIATLQQRSLCLVEVSDGVLDEDPIKDPRVLQLSEFSNLSPVPAISVLTIATLQQRSLCRVEVWDGVLDEDPIKDPRVLQLDWSQWVLSNLSSSACYTSTNHCYIAAEISLPCRGVRWST